MLRLITNGMLKCKFFTTQRLSFLDPASGPTTILRSQFGLMDLFQSITNFAEHKCTYFCHHLQLRNGSEKLNGAYGSVIDLGPTSFKGCFCEKH